MDWIILSVFATIMFACSNLIDKYIIVKWFKNPLTPIIGTGLFNLIAAAVVFFVIGFKEIPLSTIVISLIAGAITAGSIVFYLKAIKIEEISMIAAFIYISPLFTLILASIFLDEKLEMINYMGVFLLIIGAFMISIKDIRNLKFSKGLKLMLVVSFLIALSGIIQKHLLGKADVWTVYGYVRLGGFIFTIPFIILYSKDFIEIINKYGKNVILADIGTEVCYMTGLGFLIFAQNNGSVTLVNAITSIQPFFVLLFSVLITIFITKNLEEDINKKRIFQKLLAIAVMFTGVLMVT